MIGLAIFVYLLTGIGAGVAVFDQEPSDSDKGWKVACIVLLWPVLVGMLVAIAVYAAERPARKP